MAVQIKTSRGGAYVVKSVGEPERTGDALVLTLSLERADGLEKVAFRCRISTALVGSTFAGGLDALIGRLAVWFERDFEVTREVALKSIRAEGKLAEIVFDESNRGPL